MEYGVYLESSIVDLKPRLMDFLNKIIDKAKEAKEYAVSFKRKDLAELTGVDVRTTSRYLNELAERDIVEVKGVRGRSGGTVVMLNTELIRFDTSDKAILNQDVSIDDIAELKYPKKKPENNNNNNKKRNRRTKQQMIEARALNNKKQSELDRLHKKLEELGGVPDWEWFKETEDPIGNYRTYLLTRLYNRYAALFTDHHNAEVEISKEGNKVPQVTNDYDVLLTHKFLGSARWNQFEKFRDFCDENGIDPAVYLSAQFGRTVFVGGVKQKRNVLPFVNNLIGETSVGIYKDYCQRKSGHLSYKSSKTIPAMFMDDFVVVAIRNAYDSAYKSVGLLEFRQSIRDFLEGVGADDKEIAVADYYDEISATLRKNNVPATSRSALKKYIITQALTLTRGETALPKHVILGSEATRLMLASMNRHDLPKETVAEMQSYALGKLVHPFSTEEYQKEEGRKYRYQLNTLNETPLVIRLVMQRRGLYIDLVELQKAQLTYGKDIIPMDDYSVLDVEQIAKVFTKGKEEEPMIDHSAITDTRTWTLEGAISNANEIEDKLDDFLSGLG